MMWSILILVGVTLMTAGFWAPIAYKKIQEKTVKPEPAVQLVIDMLKVPDGWFVDKHYLKHPTGVKIWHANKDYGLSLSINGKEPNPRSMQGGDYNLSDAQASVLWPHVKAFIDRGEASGLNERILAFAERAREHADNVVQLRSVK